VVCRTIVVPSALCEWLVGQSEKNPLAVRKGKEKGVLGGAKRGRYEVQAFAADTFVRFCLNRVVALRL
jgi:hypothetical protein